MATGCEALSRQLSLLADVIRRAGVPAQAGVCQSVADEMARLSFDASNDEIDYARVSESASDCARALRTMADDLEDCDIALERSATAHAEELEKLARDALSETQPLDL